MLFPHRSSKFSGEFYVIPKKSNVLINQNLNSKIIKEFWANHTFKLSKMVTTTTNELLFKLGVANVPSLDGQNYALSVEKTGVCLVGSTFNDLARGFMTLLDLIEVDENDQLKLPIGVIKESPLIKTRMIHFCVFPETEMWEVEKFIRYVGALKFSHVVLEFWGMLKFDCMKELGWKNALTKKQVKKLTQMANDLGVEIIPMFNHWGHASGSRVKHGKHVVLDQNPSLQSYFSPDGWCWNINSQKVKDLLKNIREELIEVCGKGSFFHVGCDEAYGFDYSPSSMKMMCDYLNNLSNELKKQGRTMIMWGDMCLFNHPEYLQENKYITQCKTKEQEDFMLSNLDKNIIIADWQYCASKKPIESSLTLRKVGFRTLVCPWDDCGIPNMDACMKTVVEHNLTGLLHTTWNTLSVGTPKLSRVAVYCWGNWLDADLDYDIIYTKASSVYRKACPSKSNYSKSGWAKYQVGVLI